jgi:hypothetical protein
MVDRSTQKLGRRIILFRLYGFCVVLTRRNSVPCTAHASSVHSIRASPEESIRKANLAPHRISNQVLVVSNYDTIVNSDTQGIDHATSTDIGNHHLEDSAARAKFALSWWEDDDDDGKNTSDHDAIHSKFSYRRFWNYLCTNYKSRMRSMNDMSKRSNRPPSPPHPLRTDVWEIQCQWRGLARKNRPSIRKSWKRYNPTSRRHAGTGGCLYDLGTFQLEFNPIGYVRLRLPNNNFDAGIEPYSSSDDNHWIHTVTSCIGKWKLGPMGLHVRIPLPVAGPMTSTWSSHATVPLQHCMEMDFHINPFGIQPKFTRGIIYVDDLSIPSNRIAKFFRLRPIVATFTGKGIGIDTVDLSYGERL